MSIPCWFRCPISLDIFTDPVTLCTGQTYDRPCIEQWLDAGHRTCPVTMQSLADTVLVPNRTLRHLIDRWLSAAPPDDPLPPEPATAAAAADDAELSLAALKRCLQGDGNGNAKVGVLKKVVTLASESDVGRACLLQLGFSPTLLQLVFDAAMPSGRHSEVTELALECALCLMPSSGSELDRLVAVLKNEANLASFVRLLENGSGKVKAGLCRLLETIAKAAATRDLALAMASSRRVWQALLPLLQDKADAQASEAAARAVAAVCTIEAARDTAIEQGAIGALIRHLSWASGKGVAEASALAAVEALAASEAGRKALTIAACAVQVLVRHVFRMSSRNDGGEHAAAALLAVCRESRAARGEAVGAGVVTQLLLLLQSQCGARAKAKARALLKLLGSM